MGEQVNNLNRAADLATQHLEAELVWLWSLLEAHLRRLQRHGVLPSDDEVYAGTMVTPTEIRVRLELARLARERVPLETADVERAADQSRAIASRASERWWLPLDRLRRAFQLDTIDYLLLLMALGYELEPGFARLFAFLQNHFARTYPTGALVAELLLDDAGRLDVARHLDVGAPLVAFGLVTLDARDPTLATIHRALRVEPRILRLVLGQRALDPVLTTWSQHHAAADWAGEEPVVWPALALALERLGAFVATASAAFRRGDSRRGAELAIVRGAMGSGKTFLLTNVAASAGLGLLSVDLRALVAVPSELEARLAAVFREAMILDAVLVLEGFEDVVVLPGSHESEAPSERAYRMARLLQPHLARHRGIVVWGVRDQHQAIPPFEPRPEIFAVPLPDARAAVALWQRFLPPALRGDRAEPELLAQHHRLPPAFLKHAVTIATQVLSAEPAVTKKVSGTALHAALKQQLQHRLGDSARLVDSGHRWEDLVVSPDVRLQLQEIVERHRQRVRVIEEWGLGDRLGSDIGLPVLFDGPPGTGKTMSAALIGRQLELDVYQVDLSKMVSKWIGETEKNLARLFDEAERSRAILLFDEADSLFAKRTGVESSNDRYANLEVNFLLQRIERFSGIAILTTNFPESIDEAFKRRISLRVTFERPGPKEREALWRSLLRGPRLPVAPDIDFAGLAKTYDLVGGLIKNAVVRAAFIAAAGSGVIDQEALEGSARVELKKHGTLVRAQPTR